jgi:hypothetical protein
MSMHGVPRGITNPPPPISDAAAAQAEGRHAGAQTPGTLVLVFVFLAAFVLYYFVNWKLLSFLWRIG